MASLIIAYELNPAYFEFAGLGALFLSNTEGFQSSISVGVLLTACFTESLAWVAGTITSVVGVPLSVFLLALGVFLLSFETSNPHWGQVGAFTAIVFAIAVGIPGASLAHALFRFEFSLFGALFALSGVFLYRLLLARRQRKKVAGTPVQPVTAGINPELKGMFWRALALGIAASIGYAIGLELGLPRDYWVVVTIILVLRQSFGYTISFTSLLLGTIAGALIAALVILMTQNLDVLLELLFIFAILMFSVRGVNIGLVQVFIVPFIIILINLLFPGQWQLALDRVIDVTIGGVVALITAYSLGMRAAIPRSLHRHAN